MLLSEMISDLYLWNDISYLNGDIESIFVKINLPYTSKSVVVGIIYRPPKGNVTNFNDLIYNILSNESSMGKPCFVMGDFNLDISKPSGFSFLDNLRSCGFYPNIDKPTRVTPSSHSVIDNICTNSETVTGLDIDVAGILVTDISDHFPIFVHSTIQSNHIPKSGPPTYTRNYSKNNINRFLAHISNTNWDDVYVENDTNSAYNAFHHRFNEIYAGSFPFVKVSHHRKKKQVWITSGLLVSVKHKNKLYKKYLRSPTHDNKIAYNTYRNKLNSILRIAKRQHFEEIFNSAKHDTNLTWKHINSLLHKGRNQTNYPDTFTEGGRTNNDPNDIADAFNNFFVNLGPQLAGKIPTSSNRTPRPSNYNPNSFFLSPVSESDLFKVALECLKPNKAAGYDGFRPSIVRNVICFISRPLTHICNLSLHQGIFPEKLKTAKVIPIFKSGDKQQLVNYRPISILSCFSKIFERIMFNKIQSFLCKHNILSDSQFGFRPGRSTELALIDVINKLSKSHDNNRISLAVFLDLSKAFDTINHDILLDKLHVYGFRGTTYSWIKSYLTSRKQFTTFRNVDSDVRAITCGVPQGSVLGPLLFIIYVNDISLIPTNSSMVLFADDTNIFFSADNPHTLEETVCKELSLYSDWFVSNKLSLNVCKTNYMVFNNKDRNYQFNIHINNQPIAIANNVKFLGVYFDPYLKWEHHISHLCSKVARGVGILGA